MRAAVFITTTGFSEDVFPAIRGVPGVIEAHLLMGVYDVVAIVEAPDEAHLKRAISGLRAHRGVMTTTTLLYIT
ncbi:MAG: Lrp/AsnC ligand binding domain-containing protein [Conexivisphaera sp.]